MIYFFLFTTTRGIFWSCELWLCPLISIFLLPKAEHLWMAVVIYGLFDTSPPQITNKILYYWPKEEKMDMEITKQTRNFHSPRLANTYQTYIFDLLQLFNCLFRSAAADHFRLIRQWYLIDSQAKRVVNGSFFLSGSVSLNIRSPNRVTVNFGVFIDVWRWFIVVWRLWREELNFCREFFTKMDGGDGARTCEMREHKNMFINQDQFPITPIVCLIIHEGLQIRRVYIRAR
jgi:hypothetical protein